MCCMSHLVFYVIYFTYKMSGIYHKINLRVPVNCSSINNKYHQFIEYAMRNVSDLLLASSPQFLCCFLSRVCQGCSDFIHVSGASSGDVLTFFAGMCVICGVCTGEGDGKSGRLPFRIKPPSPAPVFLFLLPG